MQKYTFLLTRTLCVWLWEIYIYIYSYIRTQNLRLVGMWHLTAVMAGTHSYILCLSLSDGWRYMYMNIFIYMKQHIYLRGMYHLTAVMAGTGWRRLVGSLMCIGHFPQKWRILNGSFVENHLQLTGSYESSPPCTPSTYASDLHVIWHIFKNGSFAKRDLQLEARGGGLGSRPILKKFHETYAPS